MRLHAFCASHRRYAVGLPDFDKFGAISMGPAEYVTFRVNRCGGGEQ